jgi:hypothetical protein
VLGHLTLHDLSAVVDSEHNVIDASLHVGRRRRRKRRRGRGRGKEEGYIHRSVTDKI